MFDLGFSELVVVAVIGLIVLGPERLPKVARQAGQWIAKLQRYVTDVKSDINRQMDLDELRKLQTEVKDAAGSMESSFRSAVDQAQTEFDSISGSGSEKENSAGSAQPEPNTDWDKVYAVRRSREKLAERRLERAKQLGHKTPRRR
ncbi:MAG: Sec-independent protein translocase protein TatB [Quisquiliibacterium sp.]